MVYGPNYNEVYDDNARFSMPGQPQAQPQPSQEPAGVMPRYGGAASHLGPDLELAEERSRQQTADVQAGYGYRARQPEAKQPGMAPRAPAQQGKSKASPEQQARFKESTDALTNSLMRKDVDAVNKLWDVQNTQRQFMDNYYEVAPEGGGDWKLGQGQGRFVEQTARQPGGVRREADLATRTYTGEDGKPVSMKESPKLEIVVGPNGEDLYAVHPQGQSGLEQGLQPKIYKDPQQLIAESSPLLEIQLGLQSIMREKAAGAKGKAGSQGAGYSPEEAAQIVAWEKNRSSDSIPTTDEDRKKFAEFMFPGRAAQKPITYGDTKKNTGALADQLISDGTWDKWSANPAGEPYKRLQSEQPEVFALLNKRNPRQPPVTGQRPEDMAENQPVNTGEPIGGPVPTAQTNIDSLEAEKKVLAQAQKTLVSGQGSEEEKKKQTEINRKKAKEIDSRISTAGRDLRGEQFAKKSEQLNPLGNAVQRSMKFWKDTVKSYKDEAYRESGGEAGLKEEISTVAAIANMMGDALYRQYETNKGFDKKFMAFMNPSTDQEKAAKASVAMNKMSAKVAKIFKGDTKVASKKEPTKQELKMLKKANPGTAKKIMEKYPEFFKQLEDAFSLEEATAGMKKRRESEAEEKWEPFGPV